MTDTDVEQLLAPMRALVKEQGDLVRQLKQQSSSEAELKIAIMELKARKKRLEDKELALQTSSTQFDRIKMEEVLRRRFFYDQSFSIYNGVAGQYDFGPMGCAFMANLLSVWRKMFVMTEQMLEVECSILTPEAVLKASGHVDRFADLMVKDLVNGECFRLDHLIKANLQLVCQKKPEMKARCDDIIVRLDGMNRIEMAAILKEFDMKSYNGNELSEPIEFNLMFSTQIGPDGGLKGYLRPETAQGIFVNFKRLLEFNQGRLPFAAAQIGKAFRNEISPRSGLVRVREFTMAEIEHFCDPADKSHPKFKAVKDTQINLYSACHQMDGKSVYKSTIGDAVKAGTIANETLGYFMARIQQYLVCVGADLSRLRFRQHMANEMAHYACDCWDLEMLTSYGWIECVGCADRSAYDLTQHYSATKVKLCAEKRLSEPRAVEYVEILPDKKAIGSQFKKLAGPIIKCLAQCTPEHISEIERDFNGPAGQTRLYVDEIGTEVTISSKMVQIKQSSRVEHVEEIIPSVIEPSFGIGRILYCLLEHNFHVRSSDSSEQRCYFSLPPLVAPIKCSVLPLSSNPEFVPLVQSISGVLIENEIDHRVDKSSGSIGRRYSRTDEVAVPFGICVDFDSLKEPHTVTVRERNSMLQVRVPVNDVPLVIKDLCYGKSIWQDVTEKYPIFVQQESKQMDG